jgi:hypothetical protein
VKKALLMLFLLAPLAIAAQFHRAEQDRTISYWLLDPATHQFFISHDFTVSRPGQKYVHSFVRKGSIVAPDSKMIDLDTGQPLKTYAITGKEVNALGYYLHPTDPESVVVQGELAHPLGNGQSVRIRVQETYTDPLGYTVENGELAWKCTLGRSLNRVTLPRGWMLSSVNTPAIISLDDSGRIVLRFTNPRNDELSIEIKARRRNSPVSKGKPSPSQSYNPEF